MGKDIFDKFGECALALFDQNTNLIGQYTLNHLYDMIEEKILKSDKVYQSFKERYDRESSKLPEGFGYAVEVAKSDKQIELERQGHIFIGQDRLDNHAIDPSKKCYCGRPVK